MAKANWFFVANLFSVLSLTAPGAEEHRDKSKPSKEETTDAKFSQEEMLALLGIKPETAKPMLDLVQRLSAKEKPTDAELNELADSLPEALSYIVAQGDLFPFQFAKTPSWSADLIQKVRARNPEEAAPSDTQPSPVPERGAPAIEQHRKTPTNTKAFETKFLEARTKVMDALLAGKDPKSVQSEIRIMAKNFALVNLADRKSAFVRDSSSFPVMESTVKMFREGENPTGLPGFHSRGDGSFEKMFKKELSEAMRKPGDKLAVDEIARDMMENPNNWTGADYRGKSPYIVDSRSIPETYRYAQSALKLLGAVSAVKIQKAAGKAPTSAQKEFLEETLTEFASQPHLQRAGKGPETFTQNVMWANLLSAKALAEIKDQPELRRALESLLKDQGGIDQVRGKLQDTLYDNFNAAIGDPTKEIGAGGSLFHTSLLFSGIAQLKPEQRKEMNAKWNKVLKERNGGRTDLIQYAPYRDLPINETLTSSAGRAVTVAATNLGADPSPKNVKAGLEALQQFSDTFGTYLAEVNRNGTHQGSDLVAPYYLSPALFAAGNMIETLKKMEPQLSAGDKKNLKQLETELVRSVKGSFDPEWHSMVRTGGIYPEIGATFPSALALSFLNDVGAGTPDLPYETTGQALANQDPKIMYQELRKAFEGRNFREEEIAHLLAPHKDKLKPDNFKLAVSLGYNLLDRSVESPNSLVGLQKWASQTENLPLQKLAKMAIARHSDRPEYRVWTQIAKDSAREGETDLDLNIRARQSVANPDSSEFRDLTRSLVRSKLDLASEAREERIAELARLAQKSPDTLIQYLREIYAPGSSTELRESVVSAINRTREKSTITVSRTSKPSRRTLSSVPFVPAMPVFRLPVSIANQDTVY